MYGLRAQAAAGAGDLVDEEPLAGGVPNKDLKTH